MKKKVLAALLAAAMVFSMAACGSSSETSTAASTEASTAASTEDPIVLQIGHGMSADCAMNQALLYWGEQLEEVSGGTMTIEVFPSSELGSTTDIFDQEIAGANVGVLADGAYYADQGVPDMGIMFGPYLFDSWDDCWTLIESDWYAEQCEKLADMGIHILTSNWIYGERQTLTVNQVKTVGDLKGMKIRVPNNTIQVKGFEVLGATPTPMALGDVYTALQQGTIDGLENPLATLYDGSFHEVAKYLVLDSHVKNFTTWSCGEIFWDSLTEEQQGWLVETGNAAGEYNNELQKDADSEYLQKLTDEGVTVTELDAAAKQEFVDAAQAFYTDPEVTADWTDGLYDTVMAAMGK